MLYLSSTSVTPAAADPGILEEKVSFYILIPV
jgi:hypothetical protein